MTPDLIPYAEVNELHRKHVSGDVSFGDALQARAATPSGLSRFASSAKLASTIADCAVIFATFFIIFGAVALFGGL